DNGSGDLVYWLAGRQDEGGGLFVISPDGTTPTRLDTIDRNDAEILHAELTGEGRFVQYQVRWHDSGDEFTFRVPVDGGLSVLMPSNDSNDELQLESAIETRPNGQFFLARGDFSVDIGLYFDAVGSTSPPIELTTRVLGTQSEVQDFVVSNDGQQVLVSLRSGGSQSGQAKILAIDVADLESRFVYSEPGPRYGLDSRFTLEPASNDVITEISWRENGERSIRLYRTHFNGAISPITFPELAGLQITDVDLSPDQKSARVSVLIDDSLVRTYVADLLSGQVVPIRAKDFSWAITTEGRYLIDWGALLAVKKVHLDSLEVEVEPSLSRQHSHADDLFAWKIAADQSTILIFDSSGRENTLGAKAIDVHSGESVVLDVSIHRDLYEQIDQAVLSPDGEYLFVITRGHSLGESLVRAVPTSGAPSTVIGSWDLRDPLSKKVRFASDHRFSFLERSEDDVRWVDRFDRATQTVERFPLGRTQTRHLFPTQVRTSFGTRGNFAFFSSSGVLHRRNLDTGVDQIVYSPATSSDSITDYRVSPDNRWLIIHTFDRRLLFFETDTTTAASIEEATLSEVAHWDFAEGGKSLVVATDEFNARLGRVGLAAQTGVPTVEWLTRTDQFDRVTSLQVAPDSLQMVVGVSSQAPERLSGIYHLSIQSGQLVRLADSVNLFEASTQRFVITPDSRALLLRDESSTRPGFFIVPLDGSAWIRVDDELASGERVRLASSRNFTRQFVEGGRAMLAQGDDNEIFRISLTGESPRLILQTKETRDPVVIGGGSSVVLYNPSQTSAIELFERVPLSERSEIGAARSGEAIIRGSALFTGDGRYAIVYRQGQIVVRNFDAMTTMAHQVYDPSYEHIELIGFDASDDSVIFAVAESRNNGFRLMRLDVSSTQTHTQIVARGARRWDDYHYENFPHQIVHQLSPFESSSVITAWGVTGVATIAVGESESFTISSDDNVTSVTGLPGITRIEIKGEANATVKLRSVAWHTPAEAVTLALAGHHSVFDLTDAKIEPANSNLTVDLRDASRSVLHFDSSVLASFVSGNGPHVLLGHGDRVRPVHAENWRIRHVTIPDDASLSTYVLSEKASDRAFLVHSPLRFTNPVVPEDVDGNGHVTAIDALRVINALNQSGDDRPIELALTRLQEGLVALVDVDGNGRLSSIDALRVINELNRAQLTTPSSEPVAWAGAVDSVFEDDNDDLLDEAIGLMF
ncbi:MAG: dockerin type I domain-containing protein, partial [Planctomycetota bacterium]